MNSDLKSGDVVLVQKGGWGLLHEDEGKYVELVDLVRSDYFGGSGWTIKEYDSSLKTLDEEGSVGIGNCIGEQTFGDTPFILLNTREDGRYLISVGSKQEVDTSLGIDRGKHYRYAFRLNLTQEDIDSGFVTVNIDPYRISEVYNLGGWREHLVKKAIRGTEKGHTEDELLEELQCTLDRAKQMLEESRE